MKTIMILPRPMYIIENMVALMQIKNKNNE